MNAFLYYCRTGNIDIVKELLPKVDPSIEDNYAIRWAARNDHKDILELLLQDPRVDPSVLDNWVIKWAAYYGHKDVVQLLLRDSRVDPSADDNYAIRWAAENGHKDIVELLEQHNYKIDNIRYLELAKI